VKHRMNLYPMEYKLANGGDIASTKHNKKVYCNKGSFNNRKLSNKSVANKNFKLFKRNMHDNIFSFTDVKKKMQNPPPIIEKKISLYP